jgi:hypothetical protein
LEEEREKTLIIWLEEEREKSSSNQMIRVFSLSSSNQMIRVFSLSSSNQMIRTKERRLLSSHTSGTIQTCFNCCKLSTENLELCSSVDKRGEDGGVGLVLSSDGELD